MAERVDEYVDDEEEVVEEGEYDDILMLSRGDTTTPSSPTGGQRLELHPCAPSIVRVCLYHL